MSSQEDPGRGRRCIGTDRCGICLGYGSLHLGRMYKAVLWIGPNGRPNQQLLRAACSNRRDELKMTALFPEQDRVLSAKLGLPTRTTKKCTDWMGIEDHTLVVRFGTRA